MQHGVGDGRSSVFKGLDDDGEAFLDTETYYRS